MSSLPASLRDVRSFWACAVSFNGYRAAMAVVMTPWRAHPNTSSARRASSPGRAVKWATAHDRKRSCGQRRKLGGGRRAAGGADHDEDAAYREALQAVLDGVSADALHSSDERSRDRALALVDVEVVDSGGLNGDPKLTRSGIRGVDLGEGDLLGPTVLGDDNGFQAGLPVS